LKRAVQPIIESGIHWLWHSDGNILPILDDLLDCGIDGFQGFEEDKGFELNELLKRKCKSGKMPFIMGSVSVTTTMYGSLQGIREEKKRMKNLSDKNGGGVILAASSSVMADTPVENIMELYSAL
jgi:uroporphyrinogen-III decarboxylase